MRMASRDRVRVDANAVAQVAADREAHDAEELRAVERSARQAATIEPLAAAVKMNVDNETLTDLFDNEEWWRPYRAQFSFSRLIVNGNVVSTRGTAEVGTLDKPVAKLARLNGAAASAVSIGGRSYLLAAARLPIATEHAPIIVLGREATPAPIPARPATSAAAAAPVRPLQLGGAGVIALAG